jgi:hypothetical protein
MKKLLLTLLLLPTLAWGESLYFSGKGSGSEITTSSITWDCELTPPQLTNDVNDFGPTGIDTACALRIHGGSANRNITGLDGGTDGRILTIHNIGILYSLVLKDASSSSSTENRFILDADKTIVGDSSITLRYDGVSGGWRLFSSGSATACADDSTAECTLSATRSTSDPEFVAGKILTGYSILGVTGTAIGSGDITTSLQCHYKFDDGSGTNATDSSGNGYTMALTGTPTWVPNEGQINGALSLDGVNDYGYASGCLPPTGDFTWSAWAWQAANSTAATLFAAMVSSASSTNELQVDFASSQVNIRLKNTLVSATGPYFPPNGWHLLTLTRSSSVVTFYIDGSPATYTALTGTMNFGTCGVVIGQDPDGTSCTGTTSAFFKGYVDDFRIYSRALSAADVGLLYATNRTQTDQSASNDLTSNLSIYLPFNESSGTTAEDSTANNKDGTLINGAAFTSSGCHLNNCVILDGTNDYIEIASPGVSTGDFTYSWWAVHDTVLDTDYWLTLMATTSATSNELGFARTSINNSISIQVNSTVLVNDGYTAFGDLGWAHFAVVRKGGFVTFYVNGKPAASGYEATTLVYDTCQILLGADSDSTGCNGTPNDFLGGKMDEFRAYARALTAAEIAALAAL